MTTKNIKGLTIYPAKPFINLETAALY